MLDGYHMHFVRNTQEISLKSVTIEAAGSGRWTVQTDTSLSILSPHSGQECVRTCHCGVIDLTIILIH